MKIHEPKSVEDIKNLISYLGSCHDGSVKSSVCFTKEREIYDDGSLVYPFNEISDFVNCDIKVEMILNSYPTAKKDQIIWLEFIKAKSFSFIQKDDIDYSDIYEFKFEEKTGPSLLFSFFATENKIKVLSILCMKIICKEL